MLPVRLQLHGLAHLETNGILHRPHRVQTRAVPAQRGQANCLRVSNDRQRNKQHYRFLPSSLSTIQNAVKLYCPVSQEYACSGNRVLSSPAMVRLAGCSPGGVVGMVCREVSDTERRRCKMDGWRRVAWEEMLSPRCMPIQALPGGFQVCFSVRNKQVPDRVSVHRIQSAPCLLHTSLVPNYRRRLLIPAPPPFSEVEVWY
ncbi:hypothetical protein LY78DRAFT_439840 [Colletotrichum sublineola]|nr:hypothetical protein LY78DRAFT_439840 [Colletotrichum sublineola]